MAECQGCTAGWPLHPSKGGFYHTEVFGMRSESGNSARVHPCTRPTGQQASMGGVTMQTWNEEHRPGCHLSTAGKLGVPACHYYSEYYEMSDYEPTVRITFTLSEMNLIDSVMDSALSAGGWEEWPARRKLAESVVSKIDKFFKRRATPTTEPGCP